MSKQTDPAGAALFGSLFLLGGGAFAGVAAEGAGWITETQLNYYAGVVGLGIGVLMAAGGCWLLAQALFYGVIVDA